MRTFDHFPEPNYAPERDPEHWLTEGHEIERVANMLGKTLMPWQRYVVDRATEYRLDAEGQRVYRYSTVLVTVPRQSGKTTLVGPVQLHRMMTRPGARCFFTAQTGKDAGKRMDDLIELVNTSPLAPLFGVRLQAGDKGLDVKANGSKTRVFAPVVGALHGETPLWVGLDEIWKFSKEHGDALVGGFSPAQITLHGRAQKWFISTMGTLESGFMNDLVEKGRSGADPRMAYFEWAMRDGLDPYDPASWWTYHPALGNTLTEDGLQAETGIPMGEFIRAYCNRVTAADNPLIEPETWEALARPMTPPASLEDPVISYEVAASNQLAAVLATWRDDEGRALTRVVHQAPGASWLPDYVEALAAEWGAQVAADGGGPSVRVTDELTRRGVEVRTLTMPERGVADGQWLTEARDAGNLSHDGSQPLAAAVACAVLRTSNGVERISRDHSPGPVAALIAASVGLYAFDHPPENIGAQIW